MSVTPHSSVAVSSREQADRLGALAAIFTSQGWIAYVAATPPHQPLAICILDRANPAVCERILAAPDDRSGTWYYWRHTGELVARADNPGAAADAIAGGLICWGGRDRDAGRRRSTVTKGHAQSPPAGGPAPTTSAPHDARPSRQVRDRVPMAPVHAGQAVHSAVCRPGHTIMGDCPVDCLAPVLPQRVLNQLARAGGRAGIAVAPCGPPATVGDVVRLYRQGGQLGQIAGLGRTSLREIEASLVSLGFIAAGSSGVITPDSPVSSLGRRSSLWEPEVSLGAFGLIAAAENTNGITPGCPVECLRGVLSSRAFNRLARADGRGVRVAPCGPPTTVSDVLDLYQQGRLTEIAGLGPRCISEIEVGLVFAGLALPSVDPPCGPPGVDGKGNGRNGHGNA